MGNMADSRIVPRSGLAIIREELAAVATENLRLRGGMDEKGGELAAMDRRLVPLAARVGGEGGAERSARIGMPEAGHTAELAERSARIGMPEADRAAPNGDNKRLAASDRYYSNHHSPPRSGTWMV